MAKHELNHIKKSARCSIPASYKQFKDSDPTHPKNTHDLSTSTYRQTKVETEVRHLKQKNI
jgi:hypothetical protein